MALLQFATALLYHKARLLEEQRNHYRRVRFGIPPRVNLSGKTASIEGTTPANEEERQEQRSAAARLLSNLEDETSRSTNSDGEEVISTCSEASVESSSAPLMGSQEQTDVSNRASCSIPFSGWILIFIILSALSGGLITAKTTSHGSNGAAKTYNLTCYKCHSQFDGSSCIFNNTKPKNATINIARCQSTDQFCQVTRMDYNINDSSSARQFYSVERTCAPKCHNHCNVVGERHKLYLCHSCCTTHLCNIDNSAPQRRGWFLSLLLLLLSLALLS